MRIIPTLWLCSSLTVSAQNWALLNPAYKYNYCNDGSDTISNQIFVTHIDTLGPDSFRYELNKVVRRCDTCTTALGGSCDGCYLALDRAGEFGDACTTNGERWRLEHPGGYWEVMSTAPIGTSWLFDAGEGLTATVDTIVAAVVYGMPDSLKVVALSNGDTLTCSRDHGLMRWPGANGALDQIGEQMTASGVHVPPLPAFIAYQSGDVAQYSHGRWQIGMSAMEGESWTEKMTFISRTDHPDSIVFLVERITLHSVTWEIGPGQSQTVEYTWQDTGIWVASAAHLPFFTIIGSFPDLEIREQTLHLELTNELIISAEHGYDAEGHHQLSAKRYPFSANPPWWEAQSLFVDADTVMPGILALGTWNTVNSFDPAVVYRVGPGLVRYDAGFFEAGEYYHLDGAVIGGDTTGTLTPDDILLGIQRDAPRAHGPILFPNPAREHLSIRPGAFAGTDCRILHMNGTQILSFKLGSSGSRSIDVSDLPNGLYIVEVSSTSQVIRERLVIAH